MNYFEFHIGDYQRKTAQLSLAEHGAYLLMLQTFYATEKPLPSDRKLLYRLLRADTIRERKAIDTIAEQFWPVTEHGLVNPRAMEVLEKYREWLARQKANGSQGGRPRKTPGLFNGNPEQTHGFSGENPEQTQGVTQTKPTWGDRARVPLPTPHLDHDYTSTPTPSPQSREGARLRRDGTNPRAAGSNSRARGTNPRASGINPNALGTNPRALGTNPRADRDERNAERDEARIVWSELVASGGSRPQRTHRIQSALDAIGGWQAVRMRTDFDAAKLERGFCEAYQRGGESVPKNGAHTDLDPDDLREREEAARADH